MSVSGADLVNAAEKELGDPYVFGAEGPNSFDCSGLIQYIFRKYGIKTPRTAHEQQRFGTAVTRANLQPGDLIFFSWNGSDSAEHEGMYVGNGEMIHAPHTGTVVKRVKLSSYYWANAIAFRRFPGVTGGPATSESGGLTGAIKAGVDAITPTSVTGAINGVSNQIRDIATGVASVGKVAELVTRAFLPSNIMRGFAGLLGTMFVLIGVYFLSREARNG